MRDLGLIGLVAVGLTLGCARVESARAPVDGGAERMLVLEEPDLAAADRAVAAEGGSPSELGLASDLETPADLARRADLGPATADLSPRPDFAGSPRTGEVCADAILLPFFSNEANADVDLSGYANDLSGSCGGLSTGDAVLSFTLASTASVSIVVSPPSPGPIPTLYVYDGICDVVNQIRCTTPCANCTSATLTIAGLTAGSYYLVLDGASGSYHVRVTY